MPTKLEQVESDAALFSAAANRMKIELPTTEELAERLNELGYDMPTTSDRDGMMAVLIEHAMGWCVPDRRRVARCEYCDKPAHFMHGFLLEGVRSNPASQAYGKDDCSWCVDHKIFTCAACKPITPPGYVVGSRWENCKRFAHMFKVA